MKPIYTRFWLAAFFLLFTYSAQVFAGTNDNFADRFVLVGASPVDGSVTTDNSYTRETNENVIFGRTGGHSAWWEWQSPVTGTVVITTQGSNFDTLLGVYTGAGPFPLTLVGDNDDNPSGGLYSTVQFSANNGTIYKIAVDGFNAQSGNIVLSIVTLTNDNFNNAIALGTGNTAVGHNIGASPEPMEPLHAGDSNARSVWYTWDSTGTSNKVTITTNGSNFNTLLGVYLGGTVSTLTEVASNDDQMIDNGTFQQARVTFLPAPSTIYHIAVDGSGGAQGILQITVQDAQSPPNDDFANAIVLSGNLPLNAFGSNIDATKEPGPPPPAEPAHAGNAGGHSVWFQWQAPSAGAVSINTQGSSFDTLLAVYTGTAVNALTMVAQNDDVGGPLTYSRVFFNAAGGTIYRIAVDGKNGAMGNINLQMVSPPINDNVEGPIGPTLLSGAFPITATGNNNFGSTEPNERITIAGQNANSTIWWKWDSPGGGPINVTVSTAGSSVDTQLAVYTDPTGVHPMNVVILENDDFAGATSSQLTFTTTISTTYYIAVDSRNGTGDISLLLTNPPPNDNFGTPNIIPSAVPASTTGTNRFSSKEVGEDNHDGANAGGSSVWWKWTAPATPATMDVTITTANSNFDTLLGVYTGLTVSTLTPKAQNNNNGFSQQSQVTFTADAGIDYFIAVDGFNGQSGFISLAIVIPPANDNFANAVDLGNSVPATANGSNNFASLETGEDDHAGNFGGQSSSSIWYQWKAPSDGVVGVTTAGSNFNTVLAIYTGTAVNGLNLIANGDNTFSSLQAETQFFATNGVTYMIAVDGYFGDTGNVTITISAPPSNDIFPGTTLSGIPVSPPAGQTNRFATVEGGEPNHALGGAFGGSSIWYSWTAPGNGKVTITTGGSNFDTLLAVYTGSTVSSLNLVAKSDNFGGVNTSQLTFVAAGGTTYRIAVDGLFGGTGNVSLNIRTANTPANDDFVNRTAISSTLPVTINSTNAEATKEPSEPNHSGQIGGSSVWYSFTTSTAGKITLSTAGSEFDTTLALYTGGAVGTLTSVISSTNGQLSFNAQAGTAYALVIDGANGQSGTFTLAVGQPPANDDFANAIALASTPPVSVTGSNAFASKEGGEPNHGFDQGGASVWYSWLAPASTKVTVSTAGSDFDTSIAIYVGNNVATLTNIVQTSGNTIELNAVSGTTYRIAVDGAFDFFQLVPATGNIALSIALKPTNDDFLSATPLTTPLPITATGNNAGATKEAGEPNHGGSSAFSGNIGGASVWYSWTSPITGAITVTTAGSSFNTLLGVYTGTSLLGPPPIVYVAGNDDFGNSKQAQLTFNATAGTSYRIAVDGFDGQTGTIALGIERFSKPELAVQSLAIISANPKPLAGEQVTFRATIINNGGRAGSFNVAFVQNSATAPTRATAATSISRVDALLAGATTTVDFAVTAGTIGSYTAWAFADYSDPNGTGKGEADESDETNNAGPTSGLAWTVVPPVPAITSSLTASGQVGSAFSYTTTASNNPTSYDATGLPAGLTVSATTGAISGTPTATGTTSVTLKATNAGGTGTATLAITINPAPPVITSALSLTGVQDTALSYTITATGTDPITYSASNLPTGLSLSGTTISGTPTTFGTFVVTLTATNASGSDSKQLTLVIGDKTDNDNDGFSNELETALGTNPQSSTSTPFAGAAAGTAETLGVTGLKLALNSSVPGADAITISGFFAGTETAFDGKVIVLDVAGVVRSFTLSSKGQSPKGIDSIKVTSKSGKISFAAKLTKGSFASSFEDEGVTGTNATGGVKTVKINVLWGLKVYTKEQFISVSIKSGKVGGGGLGLDAKSGGLGGRSGGL